MILEMSCQASIQDSLFDPNLIRLTEDLRVIKMYKKGDLIDFGRYKGNLANDGLLIIEGNIDLVLQFLEVEIIPHFSIEIYKLNLSILICYEGQCNFEFTVPQLLKFSSLNIPLAISCYPVTEPI
jgi:hypothetical protein